MKKIFRLALTATFAVALGLVVTSCKDDDDKNNGGNGNGKEQAEGQMDNAGRFWAVAANLVSPFDVTDDYENKTFEPTIGEPQDGNQTIRVVTVPDMEAAAAHFAAIVDADVTASTASYTYENEAVGTMVYQKSTDGKSLATVDVSIRQIPHLQQIVYKTAEQQGTNAATGVAYYSLGDVISKTRKDGVTEYWVCIQAPLLQQGSTDCVWATLSPLPEENIYTYKGSNGNTYKLPTKIGNNKEYMKSLAELCFALTNCNGWYKNIAEGPATKGFNYIKRENVKYVNQYYWLLVAKCWEQNDLGDKFFGRGTNLVCSDMNDDDFGLRLIYNGYSWKTTFSNSPTLWESVLTTTGNGEEANGRKLTWRAMSKNVISPALELNCLTQLQKGTQWINEEFFGQLKASPTPRYVFRYATSKQLLGQTPNVYTSIASEQKGISDVYVFTQTKSIIVGPQGQPKVFTEEDVNDMNDGRKVGNYIGKDGKFYNTKAEANQNGNGAVAMVVYYDKNTKVDATHDYHGLAIALEDLKEQLSWYDNDHDMFKACLREEYMTDDYTKLKDMLNGIDVTDSICNGKVQCGYASHPLFTAIKALAPTPEGMSGWFVPSSGQIILAFEGMGLKLQTEKDLCSLVHPDGRDPKTKLDQYMKSGECEPFDGKYWTCTGFPDVIPNYWYFEYHDRLAYNLKAAPGTETCSVRPFLAF